MAIAAMKAGFCFAACIATAVSTKTSVGFLLRAALHCGAVGGVMGVREIRQYGTVVAK